MPLKSMTIMNKNEARCTRCHGKELLGLEAASRSEVHFDALWSSLSLVEGLHEGRESLAEVRGQICWNFVRLALPLGVAFALQGTLRRS